MKGSWGFPTKPDQGSEAGKHVISSTENEVGGNNKKPKKELACQVMNPSTK
jgi:hypothetical protein